MEQDPGFIAAVEEAKQGLSEGGVPIGAALVSKDGKILGRGHNMRETKWQMVCTASYMTAMVQTEAIAKSVLIYFQLGINFMKWGSFSNLD